MASCEHKETEYVGEQKTEDGVNVFRRCLSCGAAVIVTPEHNVFSVKGAQ